jgi:hypothetical protein
VTDSRIIEESAYYESLHETPLIANTIAEEIIRDEPRYF